MLTCANYNDGEAEQKHNVRIPNRNFTYMTLKLKVTDKKQRPLVAMSLNV